MPPEGFDSAHAATMLRSKFERKEIDVDEVRYIGRDPSLIYYDPENQKHQLVTAIPAYCVANRPMIGQLTEARIYRNLSKTALMDEGGEAVMQSTYVADSS